MTLTPQLRKVARKREHCIHHQFKYLIKDKLKQAEITMKLEVKEIFKLQYVKNVQTKLSCIKCIQESDKDLAEKITQILNISEKNQNFKSKPSFINWCYFVVDMDIELLNADKNNKTI